MGMVNVHHSMVTGGKAALSSIEGTAPLILSGVSDCTGWPVVLCRIVSSEMVPEVIPKLMPVDLQTGVPIHIFVTMKRAVG